jgi:hypothetical protein
MRRTELAQGELPLPPPKVKKSRKIPLETRYWAKVDKRGKDECWPWIGATDKDGYGIIGGDEEVKFYRAHRLAYQLEYGPVPPKKMVLHRCDFSGCQNPRHLRPGTALENAADTIFRNRNARKLKNDDVLTIVRLRFDLKLSYREIAKRYSCTDSNIGAICKGKSYSWLTGIGRESEQEEMAA